MNIAIEHVERRVPDLPPTKAPERQVERPVLRYHGGKFRLAPWIISHFPAHRIYVEPFGGAAGVLVRKPRAYSEVYNDLDDDIANLFRILSVRLSIRALRRKPARLGKAFHYGPHLGRAWNRDPQGSPLAQPSLRGSAAGQATSPTPSVRGD